MEISLERALASHVEKEAGEEQAQAALLEFETLSGEVRARKLGFENFYSVATRILKTRCSGKSRPPSDVKQKIGAMLDETAQPELIDLEEPRKRVTPPSVKGPLKKLAPGNPYY